MSSTQFAAKNEYSVREAAELLGLSAAEIRRCVRAGILTVPSGKTPPSSVRLGFRHLVLLRRAASLISSRIPPHRVRKALLRLKERSDDSRPLSGIDVSAQGLELIARSGGSSWDPESEQLLFDFGRPAPSTSAPVPFAPAPPALAVAGAGEISSADAWYAVACELEDAQPEEALKAYGRAVALDPGHAESLVNWGRLLHVAGDAAGAEQKFRQALAARDDLRALALFNLGVALEDLGRVQEALEAYEASLREDPSSEDAHFNVARVYERLGERALALRHLRQYRALVQGR